MSTMNNLSLISLFRKNFFYIQESWGQLEKVASRLMLLLRILSKMENGFWVNGDLNRFVVGQSISPFVEICNDLIRGFTCVRRAIWKDLIAKMASLEIIFWGRFYPIGICYFNFWNKDVLRVLGFELPTKFNILLHFPRILEYFSLVFPPMHCHIFSLVVALVFPSSVLSHVINRPCVAGAVLQIPLWLIQYLTMTYYTKAILKFNKLVHELLHCKRARGTRN